MFTKPGQKEDSPLPGQLHVQINKTLEQGVKYVQN